jgi:hypothetical protein
VYRTRRSGGGVPTTRWSFPLFCYHQQYLAKVPNGYCGIGGTGVACPIGTGVEADRKD